MANLLWHSTMMLRKCGLFMLMVTVVVPIFLFTDKSGPFNKASSSTNEFVADISASEPIKVFEELDRNIYARNLTTFGAASRMSFTRISDSAQDPPSLDSVEHKSRALYAVDIGDQSKKVNPIRQVTDVLPKEVDDPVPQDSQSTDENVTGEEYSGFNFKTRPEISSKASENTEAKNDWQFDQHSVKTDARAAIKPIVEKQNDRTIFADAQVRLLKDQLIRAKVYLSFSATKNNPHFIRELRLRMKEIQRALGDATDDSGLSKNANEKLKAMELTLAKGKQIQDDCAAVVKKLRAILHSTEEQLRVHKKQTTFLTQLTAKTLPKGLHCLPLRLSTEYYALNLQERGFPNPDKLEDPKLYHFAIFSDNILATSVVVNSTVFHAKEPWNHVFHIVTDRLNYAAMRMWFLANPPGKATIQVQNIEEFTWLNSIYSPLLQQLGSPSIIDYYLKTHHANSDSNLKFRNPKYLSVLNHLRFYLPEIFPKLGKVLFLDDDIVVQKDLSSLWSIDLKGSVNGAVQTCGENFHRLDRYLNFSNPIISKTFDPHACGWAYGMNIFDLKEWKKQNITQIYHNWQKLNHNRQLWKLGTLPPGLATFWNLTYPIDRFWHVLGLGYDPHVSQKEIDRAAVVHYSGNMKPWLEVSIPRYRGYWARFVDYDNVYLRECNINP